MKAALLDLQPPTIVQAIISKSTAQNLRKFAQLHGISGKKNMQKNIVPPAQKGV